MNRKMEAQKTRSWRIRGASFFPLAATMLVACSAQAPFLLAKNTQPTWGALTKGNCELSYGGYRKHSAVLNDISSGSWEEACFKTNHATLGYAHQCVSRWGKMWGEWWKQDDKCKKHELMAMPVRWGAVSREETCPEIAGLVDGTFRRYYAKLWGSPGNWEAACQHWPLTVGGVHFGTPDLEKGRKLCRNRAGEGMWAEWYVKDPTCKGKPTAPERGGVGNLESQETMYGFADLHAHPFVNRAFGGAFFGSANGTLEKAFANHPKANMNPHQWYAWYSRSVSSQSFLDLLWLVNAKMGHQVAPWDNPNSGFPDFGAPDAWNPGEAWPRVWDSSHQQMHNVWLARAHTGGLRLLVALGVNSGVLWGDRDADETRLPQSGKVNIGKYFPPTESLDDWTSLLAQTQEAHKLAHDHPWIELVFTPDEAETAIKNGKLAMVWGSEIDQAFNCRADWGKTRDARARSSHGAVICDARDIDRAVMTHDMLGIRHVFPLHLKDNGLGGVGINSPATFQGPSWQDGYERCKNVEGMAGFSEAGKVLLVDNTLAPMMDVCALTGLRNLGKYAVRASWSLGHLVDVGHMSRRALDDTADMADRYGVPILTGHTGVFELSVGDRRHEGNTHRYQFQRILKTGGMVGLIAHQGALGDFASFPDSKLPHTIGGSSQTWVQAASYLRSLGFGTYKANDGNVYGNLTYSTDFNGFAPLPIGRDQEYWFRDKVDRRKHWYGAVANPVVKPMTYPFQLPSKLKKADLPDPDNIYAPHLKAPRYESCRSGVTGECLGQAKLNPWSKTSATVDFNKRGVATVGQIPDFFEDMRAQGLTEADLEPVYRSALGYVDMWRRLTNGAEGALYWFDPALDEQYDKDLYPLKRVPADGDWLTVDDTSSGRKICRASVKMTTTRRDGTSAHVHDHYLLGLELENGKCVTTDRERGELPDRDRLAKRKQKRAHRWVPANTPANLIGNETFVRLGERAWVCRGTKIAAVGVTTDLGSDAVCSAVGYENGEAVYSEIRGDDFSRLVAEMPLMKKDAQQ